LTVVWHILQCTRLAACNQFVGKDLSLAVIDAFYPLLLSVLVYSAGLTIQVFWHHSECVQVQGEGWTQNEINAYLLRNQITDFCLHSTMALFY